ncbi:type I-B CRISPR-associated protein Cas7/Csh2 [Anaerophaga thermohalophila]|jgi:CRISPR-associated protein Csh2|uniref:type I-B CRISPR-associated protein Cas7/Csh2 n=1 Tax=Anaerophaga thermohalophila TaxID=177400 RepID=UPI0002FAA60B|nr:type I-B CRISPR-associated protein Cas7/Csh2 [Anaerophaga thermohalophila]
MTNHLKKSEILFLYETSYNIPNGDPFTGEQRYDEETKKILVSDVRIKRFVRDYLNERGYEIYVVNDKSFAEGDESGSASRIKSLQNKFKAEIEAEEKRSKEQKKQFSPALFVMGKCIDVKLFGGIATGKGDAVNLTGPVQFALLNPSFNEVVLRMHQNTSVFTSSAENKQGAIGTTTVVPYSLIQIHGWVNPKVAERTGMTENDLKLMYEGLWYGTSGDGSSHSRSKVGQNSVLLLEIEYSQNNQKIYGIDRLIELKPKKDKKGEQLRSMDDYELDFSKLLSVAETEKISKIKYYTEIESIKSVFSGKNKFEKINFTENNTVSK